MNRWAAAEGSAYPLGVSFVPRDNTYNFAIYSKHATSVSLHLYRRSDSVTPVFTYCFDYLKNKSGRVWHCRVPAPVVDRAAFYGYQIEGVFDPARGFRFDPDKILLDPYAREIYFPPAFSRVAASGPGSNAGMAPLGILHAGPDPFDWMGDRKPRHTHDAVVYEVHVRGFSRSSNSGVDGSQRGTFTGLIQKIPYLKELGVTVMEIMPVFQFDPEEGNYWGYMPLSFFALHHLYSSLNDHRGRLDEFREMVKAMHKADIEVILDVVYNHTTEDNETGPTYSFRGIDNTTYYLLDLNTGAYRNDAGTGNVLRTGNPHVRSLILASLRYWVSVMHVDGFRFDLASLLTRSTDGTIDLNGPPIITGIRTDPILRDCRLIAEAWDISVSQLGRCFPDSTWFQWNGMFRDQVRRFVKSDPGMVGHIMKRLYGSDDLFPDTLHDAYHAYQSVNYVTSHDGFCLYDLVSYNVKHNEANGNDNLDGVDENFSWNCGHEGDKDVPPPVMNLRKKQIKNLCCIVLMSNGTPMLCAGDEFMNTQQGNNNPYNQDNEITWLDWDLLEQNKDIFRFFKLMIAFRKAHPSIGRSRYWREDVKWYGLGRDVDFSEDSRSFAFCLHGASQGDRDIYMMLNAFWEDLEFTIQEGKSSEWVRAVDTSLDSPDDISEPGEEKRLTSLGYRVKARSMVVLLRN